MFFLFLSPCTIFTQTKITVRGSIGDANSKEQLIGANIVVSNNNNNDDNIATQSNSYGFYSLTVLRDSFDLECSYIGYKSFKMSFSPRTDTVLNILLEAQDILNTLEVTANKNKNITTTQTSVLSVPIKQLSSVPTLIGEKDLFKSLQLLPGIQFGQEGTTGLLIRGGSSDQNLILLDDVPMYNVSHLYGFFSVFNTDAIKTADVYKGGFQAKHGGRLSSVIDIRTKDGNMTKWQGNASIGVLSFSGNIEGPIIKDKLSVFLSARRSVLDLWTLGLNTKSDNGDSDSKLGYYFYDVNFKANFIHDDKNRFYVSFFNGKDRNNITSKSDDIQDSAKISQSGGTRTGWSNMVASLRWNKIFNNIFFGNFTASVNNYQFSTGGFGTLKTDVKSIESKYEYFSSIKDLTLKQNFDYYLNAKNHIGIGGAQSLKIFRPGVEVSSISQNNITDTLLSSPSVYTFNFNAYIQDEMSITPKLNINAGLRYDYFQSDGYSFHYLQPRFSARLLLNNTTSLKTSFSAITQDLHLLTNSTAGLPTDLWLPANKNVKPERSQQITLGIFKNFEKKSWETSIELYYKSFNGIIEYKEGASFLNTFSGWENKVEIGKGESYGIEFFLHKKEGKVNGWLSYTLSCNNRQFQNINQGNIFPFRYDRRHYLNLFLTKIFKEGRRSYSLAFVLASGNPVSLPTDKYRVANFSSKNVFLFTNFLDQQSYFFDRDALYYPKRNNYRMRVYNRLDIMYNYIKERKKYVRTFSIGVYNLLFYRNPYFITVSDESYLWLRQPQFGRKIVVREISLFNFIPAFNLSYKFK